MIYIHSGVHEATAGLQGLLVIYIHSGVHEATAGLQGLYAGPALL